MSKGHDENENLNGALVEGILKAKVASAVAPGSVLELPLSQWEIVCLFTPLAEDWGKLLERLRTTPWEPVAFSNPKNWGKEDILKSLRRHGLGSMAKIVIRDRNWADSMAEMRF
jgi:hypothetical protein